MQPKLSTLRSKKVDKHPGLAHGNQHDQVLYSSVMARSMLGQSGNLTGCRSGVFVRWHG